MLSKLMERVTTGTWGDVSPASMNALADGIALPDFGVAPLPAHIARLLPDAPEKAKFIAYQPDVSMYRWDVSSWGSYRG